MPPPTIAIPGTIPLSMLPTCIDPPLPLQQPVEAPKSSKRSSSTVSPLARAWPWPRKVEVMKSSFPERRADPDGRGLLPLALVDRAGHRPLQEQELHPVLELADQDHPLVETEEEGAIVSLEGPGRGLREGICSCVIRWLSLFRDSPRLLGAIQAP